MQRFAAGLDGFREPGPIPLSELFMFSDILGVSWLSGWPEFSSHHTFLQTGVSLLGGAALPVGFSISQDSPSDAGGFIRHCDSR